MSDFAVPLCHICDAREWANGRDRVPVCPHYLVTFPCPTCAHPRKFRVTWRDDSSIFSVALSCDFCDSRRGPPVGSIVWAYVRLKSNPTAGDPLATSDLGIGLARFRRLLARCFDVSTDRWGWSDGWGSLDRAWECLVGALVKYGHAATPRDAHTLSMSAVIPIMESAIRAREKRPDLLPAEAFAPDLPPAVAAERQPEAPAPVPAAGKPDGEPEANTVKASSEKQPPKEPSEKAIQCYRMKMITGEGTTQAEIAAKVYGDRKKQYQVSRDLEKARAWLEAGNILPVLDTARPKLVSMDPRKLEQGPRRDGRR